MNLALNNLHRLICHKTQIINQPILLSKALYTIFKSEAKKKPHIIICRVISSHMGPIYIEIPYI